MALWSLFARGLTRSPLSSDAAVGDAPLSGESGLVCPALRISQNVSTHLPITESTGSALSSLSENLAYFTSRQHQQSFRQPVSDLSLQEKLVSYAFFGNRTSAAAHGSHAHGKNGGVICSNFAVEPGEIQRLLRRCPGSMDLRDLSSTKRKV